ncbi:GNAT family N-acetyltransferase [Paraburkholderia sabiae]|uniref:GNAT family N-acetyltransferase n=1 Tax=Paraburkholderia sabiae TaxID=273251 RepID=A0ABU9QSC5_9BURK|nr:GNAT family N-acetyltransferase [Paraburkholderia sabiae]WJZ79345.1 GNAT family N-acetyltransferase [Paraburkholderia sabiae]CAD6563015.1 Acetyltransferase [Paraburkholderia sabiae]
MLIELTDSPEADDEAFVIAQTRAFNAAFTKDDLRPLCVFVRDGNGSIVGGLTAKTCWDYLEIQFLWVDESHRANGLASDLMKTAEREAANRGCKHVFLDTLSFQAPGFYEKLGYSEFGRLEGFNGRHLRHFLHKSLAPSAYVQR